MSSKEMPRSGVNTETCSKYHANMRNHTVTRSRHFLIGQNLPNWINFVQRTGKNMSKANRSAGSALWQKPYSL